jgi:hypothetical protein
MRREWTWILAVVVAFAVGATGAEAYARWGVPFYTAATTLIAEMHPWRVIKVGVTQDEAKHGAVLRLTAEVRRHREDLRPAAVVVSRVEVGEVVETPIVFWTLVLMWPAQTARQRGLRIVVAIPMFLALEVVTTTCQLLHPLAEASALLAGETDPLTVWERWSRFLEAGGHFVLEVGAGLLSVAIISRTRPSRERFGTAAA